MWIYIERKFNAGQFKSLGKERLVVNDVLVLEFDNKGLLVEKKIHSINEMNDLNISENKTLVLERKEAFIKSFLSSLIKKINDPLGVKKIK